MDKFAQLEKLSELKDKWILTEEEFANEKIGILQSESKQINNNTPQEALYKQEQIETRSYQAPQQNYNTNSYNQNIPTHSQSTNEFFSFATFFSWNGRISRSYFWGVLGVYLGIYICMLIAMTILEVERGSKYASLFWFCFIIFVICAYWSHMVTSIKRFHDMNQTGWLIFVPLYNFIGPAFIEWTHGPNKYGADPVER